MQPTSLAVTTAAFAPIAPALTPAADARLVRVASTRSGRYADKHGGRGMTDKPKGGAPRWLFTAIMIGGFVACGIYLGMMRIEGMSTGDLLRAVGFGVLGFLMLWGMIARR